MYRENEKMISALALTLCLALGMTTGSLASAADNEGAAYTTGVASVDQHMDAVARAKAKAAKAAKKAGKTKKTRPARRRLYRPSQPLQPAQPPSPQSSAMSRGRRNLPEPAASCATIIP